MNTKQESETQYDDTSLGLIRLENNPGLEEQDLYDKLDLPILYTARADSGFTLPNLLESGVSPHLPNNLLFHVYGAFENENGFWYPDQFGEMSLWAMQCYHNEFKQAYPDRPFNIFIAGDHRDERPGGTTISQIYTRLVLDKLGEETNAYVYCEGYSGKKGAHDSTAEIDFMVRHLPNRGRINTERPNAISLSVAAHRKHLTTVVDTLGLTSIVPVSAEGLLAFLGQKYELNRFLYNDIAKIGAMNPSIPGNHMESYILQSIALDETKERQIMVQQMAGPLAGGVIRGLQYASNVNPRRKRQVLEWMNRFGQRF